jgi:hypothetical protein
MFRTSRVTAHWLRVIVGLSVIAAGLGFWSGQARANLFDTACSGGFYGWRYSGMCYQSGLACTSCSANCQDEACSGCPAGDGVASGCTHQPCVATNCWESCW